MVYKENPKTKDSGILCCIPQKGRCPQGCEDCFFQSGRSYLEPLEKNLPNMPTLEEAKMRLVRVNADGNDSNVDRENVLLTTSNYPMVSYNTSYLKDIEGYKMPVILTVNPAVKTNTGYWKLPSIPSNLMFIRVRTNTWNLSLVDKIVNYYSANSVPIILTFMAYYSKKISWRHKRNYIYRKRTLNSYWAITTKAWRKIMKKYEDNIWVYSCGKIEGEKGITKCRYCGNCLREYFATMERLR